MIVRKDLYIVVLLLLLASVDALAQRLTFSSIDTSGYPILKGRVYALDAAGRPLGGLSSGDFTLTEDGARREVLSVSCPSPPSFRAISSVLTIDISGSMRSAAEGTSGGTTPNIILARAAAAAWITALPEGESEIAITSFDSQSLVNQDFTRDRSRLLAAVQSLAPAGGTSYDAGLISSPAGALRIAEGGEHRRIIVFLTDGLGGGNEEAIVAAAQRIDATIFCVTLGMPAPDVLKRVARRTGGEFYENVTTVEEAESIYRAILYRAGGGEPCEITWRDQPGCATDRLLSVSIPGRAPASTLRYGAPASAIGRLVIQPPAVAFKTTTGSSMQVTLRATNRPITVRSIEPVERGAVFSLEGAGTPFTLAAGESRIVTVRYQPTDGRYAYNRWKIESDACTGSMIFASGGTAARGAQQTAIHLVRPDGGEVFRAGKVTTIAWEGIGAAEPVKLDYSTNSGESWTTIAARTSGLSYEWTVPATPSTKCLARVTTLSSASGSPSSAPKLRGLSDFSMTPDGSRLVSFARSYDDVVDTIVVWNLATGERLQSFPFRETGRERPANPNSRIPISRLSYTPDGRFIVVETMMNETFLLDPATGNYLWRFDGSLPNDVTQDYQGHNSFFSPDGSRLIVRARDEPAIVVLDLMSGEKILTIPTARNRISTVDFTPDGTHLATTSNSSVAQLWSLETGQLLQTFSAAGKTNVIRPSSDGTTIMTVGGDWRGDTIFAWNRSTGALLGSVRTGGNPFLSPDAATAVVWKNGLPLLIDARTGATIFRLHPPGVREGEENASRHASFSSDGSLVALYDRKTIEVWDTRSGTRVKEFTSNTKHANRVRISPDNATLVWNLGWELQVDRLEKPVTIQEDRSDRVWSIVVDTRPVGRDVDFGARPIGSTTDSIVTAFIRNDGTGTLTVDSIAIGGANAADFALVSGIAPFEIAAGRSHTVEFRFIPTTAGRRSATIEIDAGGRRLTQTLRGEGVRPQLVIETGLVDFDKVPVGTTRDTTVQVLLRNVGSAPVGVGGAELVGPDTAQFRLVGGGGAFTLAPGETRPISLRFAPVASGRSSSRLAFRQSSGDPLFADIFGNGIGPEDDERYVDPTTFRTIASPNAVIPPQGTIVAGSYDVVGLMAGYAATDNVMILAGGGLPLPDDWGGVKGSMYGAYSIGVKAGLTLLERLDLAAGFQWGRSMFDQEATPDVTESEITVNVPYLAISYGDDDSRVSATYGYAWKHHAITTGEFDVEAGIISIGGDYRFANRWKGAIEVISMKTLGYIPIAATARYFGHTWALDIGAAYLGIGEGPELPIAPVVSYVMVF